jgi:tetratricopeptide (TPR) repeat protein
VSGPDPRPSDRILFIPAAFRPLPGVTHRFDLGVHYFLRGEYESAVRTFRDVVRDEPANAAAWSYYGISLAHVGQPGDAEGALARAIALGPRNGEAWFHLGVARSLREEWGEAVTAYRHAVALEPTDMVAWHRLGVALSESGDETSAAAAFERALVLSQDVPSEDTSLPSPRHRMDDHLAEAGEREGAREAKSWLDLALSLLSLGDEEEAIAAYERAYTLDPERARLSLFRPMLRLVTTLEEDVPPESSEAGPPAAPNRPEELRPPRRNPRPEIG